MSAGGLSETVLAELRPSRLLSAHYYVLILFLLAGAVLSLLGFLPFLGESLRFTLPAALAALSFVFFVSSEIRRKSHKYTVYDTRIGVSEGILRKRVQYMPFNRVERVEINQSLIGRILGIGNVIVDTGDDQVKLQSIRSPAKAERLVSGRISGSTLQRPVSSY